MTERRQIEQEEETSDIEILASPLKKPKSQKLDSTRKNGSLKLDLEKIQSFPSSPKVISEINSPRTKFISKKFKSFALGEKVLDSFACAAANGALVLQGKLYLTDRCCYFYSPFNSKTLLGKGSKLRIKLSDLEAVKMETTLLFFANTLRFFYKSGEQIVFTSFLSRDSCYNQIVNLLTRQSIVEKAQRVVEPLQ